MACKTLRAPAWLDVETRRPMRHAFEVRHESFRSPEFVALLRAHGVALVVADTAGRFPYLEDVTGDFVYVRLHGDTELYTSGYSSDALDRWAGKVRAWQAGESPVGEHTVAPPAARPGRTRTATRLLRFRVRSPSGGRPGLRTSP